MYMRLCLDLVFGFGMGSKCKDGILGVFPVGCKGVPWEQRLECTQWGQTTGHHRPGQECKQQIPVQPRLSLKENALAFVTTVKRGASGHWKERPDIWTFPKLLLLPTHLCTENSPSLAGQRLPSGCSWTRSQSLRTLGLDCLTSSRERKPVKSVSGNIVLDNDSLRCISRPGAVWDYAIRRKSQPV